MLRRYHLDATVERFDDVVLGGSPLRLWRLTPAGTNLVARLAGGDAVDDSKLVDALLDAGAIHPEPSGSAGTPSASDVTLVLPVYAAGVADTARGGAPIAPVVRDAPGAVIVVDDGSPIAVEGATVRLPTNRGPAAARNAGLALVETQFVAFVDTDVTVSDGWLAPLLAHFADARVGLVAPRVRSEPGGSRLAHYESKSSPLDLGPQPARVEAGSRVGYVPAAAIVCRTDAVRAIGGFDESLRVGEDVDLVWRLAQAAWRCRYEPASEVWHTPRPTWSAWWRQRVAYGSSAAALGRRHGRAVAPVRANAWSWAAWLAALAGWPLAGAAIVTATGALLVQKLPGVPPARSLRLATIGTLAAGEQIAEGVRRVWWPLLAIAALRLRPPRRALLAAFVVPLVRSRHPLRLADDLAYSVGVWRGTIAERHLAALAPDINRWPPRPAG